MFFENECSSKFPLSQGASFCDVFASSSSGLSVEVVEQLAVGDMVYTDRSFDFTSIGSFDAQCQYIRGANNEKTTAAADVQWTLQVGCPVTVYLDFWGGAAHASRV